MNPLHFYIELHCSALSEVENGMIVYNDDTGAPYDLETTATFQCKEGFVLLGGDIMRTCDDDGTTSNGIWSGMPPTCSGIVCHNVM